MSGATIVNAFKTYNEKGLLGAAITLFGLDKHLTKRIENTIRINAGDSNVFSMIERRLARTKLMRQAATFGSDAAEFSEQLIGFSTAMDAARTYVLDKNNKSKHYCVYLTYCGEAQTSPYYVITIRHAITAEPILISTIRGVN